MRHISLIMLFGVLGILTGILAVVAWGMFGYYATVVYNFEELVIFGFVSIVGFLLMVGCLCLMILFEVVEW